MKTVTNKELEVLDAIINNEYQDFDKNSPDYKDLSPTWMSVVKDYSFTGKVFSGLISSLTEKKLIETDIEDKGNETIWITKEGFETWLSHQ